ncbi:MAG: bifunctional metallophosphatase/5'-nucleotidase [Fidelibacterota bacterium]
MKYSFPDNKILVFLIFIFSLACQSSNNAADQPGSIRHLTILYTNDEHGWLIREESIGGASELMYQWITTEGYSDTEPFLILSGGDNWTGPAISTWFQGESTVEIMNAIGYDAAAIGNHEFDFSQDGLQTRVDQAEFPYLSANMRSESTGEIAQPALPYTIRVVNDIVVGIIGLTTMVADDINFPDNVQDIDFVDYQTALDEIVPEVENEGAELIIVISHMGSYEMTNLLPVLESYNIALIGGGHTHEKVANIQNGIAVIEGGSYFSAYARTDIDFDIEADSVVSISVSVHDNYASGQDDEISDIIANWQAQLDAQLSTPIGYVSESISRYSDPMYNLIPDAWLWAYPDADVALTNRGGLRQDLPAGVITIETWVGILPFENFLVEMTLTGNELITGIGNLVVGGMTTLPDYQLADGTAINPDSTYRVLTTDYVYSTSSLFSQFDDNPLELAIHWRQPVIEWIQSLNTSETDPLENYLDYTPRQ